MIEIVDKMNTCDQSDLKTTIFISKVKFFSKEVRKCFEKHSILASMQIQIFYKYITKTHFCRAFLKKKLFQYCERFMITLIIEIKLSFWLNCEKWRIDLINLTMLRNILRNAFNVHVMNQSLEISLCIQFKWCIRSILLSWIL